MIDGMTFMAKERLENALIAENGEDDDGGLDARDPNTELNMEVEAQKAEVRRQRIDLRLLRNFDKRKATSRKSGKYERVRVEQSHHSDYS